MHSLLVVVDGDLTADIMTEGLPLDTSVIGKKTILFSVADSSGRMGV